MRRRCRVDKIQKEVVQALRSQGCSVQCLHTVGKGCPDLLVGYNGVNYLIEVKDGEKAKLTPDEKAFFETWAGQAAIAANVKDATGLILSNPCSVRL